MGPATTFTSGHGYVKMALPGRPGLTVERTDFVPGEARGALIGLRFSAPGAAQTFDLAVQAHSELMSAYPWGETKADGQPFTQLQVNQPDSAAMSPDKNALVFTDSGTPPLAPHNWAAAVGATPPPTAVEPGPPNSGFRGPQEPPTICPPSGPDPANKQSADCDDAKYGNGAGGRLTYDDVTVPAGGERTIWFGVAGSESGATDARAALSTMLENPAAALQRKVDERAALAARTKLDLPGDPQLREGIVGSKQTLADAVQDANGLQVRETNAAPRFRAPAGTVDHARWIAAGFP